MPRMIVYRGIAVSKTLKFNDNIAPSGTWQNIILKISKKICSFGKCAYLCTVKIGRVKSC